jgi:hypothetical protein
LYSLAERPGPKVAGVDVRFDVKPAPREASCSEHEYVIEIDAMVIYMHIRRLQLNAATLAEPRGRDLSLPLSLLLSLPSKTAVPKHRATSLQLAPVMVNTAAAVARTWKAAATVVAASAVALTG